MTDFEARMAALRGDFIERSSADAATIDRHAAAGAWREVRDLSHGIVGRAGMFGFPELSRDARQLESAIEGDEDTPVLLMLATGLTAKLRGLEQPR